MIDFLTTTGKNRGSIILTELARFIGINEGGLRKRKAKNSKEFEIYYLGSLCLANSVSREEIVDIIKQRGERMKKKNNEKNFSEKYLVECFDIKDITKPVKKDETIIDASGKGDALDLGHSYFEEKYPDIFRLIDVRRV